MIGHRTCSHGFAAFCTAAALLSPPALARPCGGPAVRIVVARAIEHAGLGRNQDASFRRRVRWAALLPRFSARLAHSAAYAESWDISPRQPDPDLNNSLALRWEFRATWDLARLVFDPREIGVSQRTSQLDRERRRLTAQVVRLYYDRCGLIDEQRELAGGLEASKRLRLRRATALLDALTGGLLARDGTLDE